MKRFVMMHKADAQVEAGVAPSQELMARMGGLIGEMFATGAFVAGEGLAPTAEGVRLHVSKGRRTVTRGPFVGSNELVASFAMVRVRSLNEAIDWASRIAKVLGDVDLYIGRVKEEWDLGLAPKPKGAPLRYLIIRKSDAQSEANVAPGPDIQVRMRQLLSEMTKEGVLLAAERLLPSAVAVRLTVSDGKHQVIDGPFAESKELIAGYCIVSVAARDDAVTWATRFGELLCRYAPADSVEVDVRELAEGTGFV
jgi:hypothetical protein